MCSDAAESDAVAAAHHRKKKKRQLPISKATYMVVPGIKEEDKLVVVTQDNSVSIRLPEKIKDLT